MKISVTREFNNHDVIGMLTLRDDVELSPDFELAFSYVVDPTTKRKRVVSVSLVAKPSVAFVESKSV